MKQKKLCNRNIFFFHEVLERCVQDSDDNYNSKTVQKDLELAQKVQALDKRHVFFSEKQLNSGAHKFLKLSLLKREVFFPENHPGIKNEMILSDSEQHHVTDLESILIVCLFS